MLKVVVKLVKLINRLAHLPLWHLVVGLLSKNLDIDFAVEHTLQNILREEFAELFRNRFVVSHFNFQLVRNHPLHNLKQHCLLMCKHRLRFSQILVELFTDVLNVRFLTSEQLHRHVVVFEVLLNLLDVPPVGFQG